MLILRFSDFSKKKERFYYFIEKMLYCYTEILVEILQFYRVSKDVFIIIYIFKKQMQ